MPKETITTDHRSQNALQVGWTKKTGDIQIGIENSRDFRFVLTTEERAAAVRKFDKLKLEDKAGNIIPSEKLVDAVYSSLWVDLDRDSINKLINQLRTVRDKAFGKDE